MYTPPAASDERFKIMIAKGELRDPARDARVVPYKLYYPVLNEAPDQSSPSRLREGELEGEGLLGTSNRKKALPPGPPPEGGRGESEGNNGKAPLIIWSHGLGGSRDGAGFLARFVASHGYAVCNIQHAGTDSSLWEGKPGHPWDNIRKAHIPRQASLDRFRDVPFVLNSLGIIAADHPEAGAVMNTGTLGMSGHSFGAMTTQIMAGQKFPNIAGDLVALREPRFKAGILYSPVPISHLTDAPPAEIYGSIAMPLFHMTGTEDSSPVEKFGYEQRLTVRQYSGGPEQHLLVLEGGDHMVYNGSRGQLQENPKRQVHEDILKIASLAYWDCYLKEDQAARAWLTGGGFAAWLNGEGRYEFRP